jgi:hypothetical protein
LLNIIYGLRVGARNDRGGSARNDRGGSARNDRGANSNLLTLSERNAFMLFGFRPYFALQFPNCRNFEQKKGYGVTLFGEKGVPFVFLRIFRLRLRTEGEIHQIEGVYLVKKAFRSYS